jgi:peroxiredoxin
LDSNPAVRDPGNPRWSLSTQLLIGILIGAAITLIILAGFPGEQSSQSDDVVSITTVDSSVDGAYSEASGPLIGEIAPDFTLHDIHGRTFNLNDYDGNIVLLNFWATWCGPCRLEMPLLEQYHQDLVEDDFVILAINLQESVTTVQDFVEEVGLSFPVLLDSDGHVVEQYRIIGYPSTILIDRDGRIQFIHIGIISEAQLHEYLGQVGLTL